ncbi:MAG: hypothetical protein HY016_12025 [Nitrosomonadales bacterium]|nr:hypothetical protein [Nitrosomonadales bacterium]
MIKTPTVFVLGAGASMPFGFPSGAMLRNSICKATAGDTHTDLKAAFENKFGIGKQETRCFGDTFQRSNIGTIDEFLGRNPHFMEIGKLAIAYYLCGYENPDAVRRLDNDDNWYSALWKVLTDGIDTADDLARNQVKFISFNYDRSLEFFLHDSTKNTFGVTDAQAFKAWAKIDISHVYGLLGEFNYISNGNARQYISDQSAARLKVAASSIAIMPEAREDGEQFQNARNWLYEAERICFLGFGFDVLNVRRLGLVDIAIRRSQENRRIHSLVASTFERTSKEIEWISLKIGGSLFFNQLLFNGKNLQTLRNSDLLWP